MDIANLLTNTLSADRNLREDATRQLEAFAQENYANYTLMLCQQLANEQIDDNVRMAAGLALKNSLTAKEYSRKEEQTQRWLSLDENSRLQVKQGSLVALGSRRKIIGSTAGQVVAAIAEIELPLGQWQELIPIFLENVQSDDAVLKVATLQAIGFVCEQTNPAALAAQSDRILTAVVAAAQKDEPNDDVRIAAIRALIDTLEFSKENFEREGERNYVMQTICEATQSPNTELQANAFECLVKIMQIYYDLMEPYGERALFGLTFAGMNSQDEKVALQAIEFWSTVCEEEISIKEHLRDAEELNEVPDRKLFSFADRALSHVVPVLLWLLTKQEEDVDEDEWNESMAAATCLSLFAQCVRDAIVPHIVPFVETNIQNTDWRYREAAVMSFGCIMDGPDEKVLTSLVDQALPTLIRMMKDPVVNVKDTVAWTLGRVCELLIHCIKPEIHLPELISALVYGLQDNPRIVSNCCWSLMNLAQQLGPAIGTEMPTSSLSPYFEGLTAALIGFSERSDNEANCRTSAYEAVSTLVLYSAQDCLTMVQNVALEILGRLETSITMENQIVGMDERAEHSELQSCLLGVLVNCIRRLNKDIVSVADRIMTLLLQLLNSPSKQSTTREDAFLAVASMINALEADFARYAEPFMPHLFTALQTPAEYQLCSIAVGIIGDLARSLGEGIVMYCNSFMQLLVSNLQSPVLHRNVKPNILSCFGDVAMAIGDKFEPYLEIVMMVLQQAGSMRAEKDNYEMIEYVNTLHEGNVEAYVGIVQGFTATDSPKLMALTPYVPGMFQFLQALALDPNRSESLTRAMVGLLGDLAAAFGNQLKPILQQAEWVQPLLKEVRISRHYGTSSKETAKWAKEMVKRAMQ